MADGEKKKRDWGARRKRMEMFTRPVREPGVVVLSEDAQRLAAEVVPLVDAALDSSWYEQHGNDVDVAVAELCMLRRAAAAEARASQGGDAAVRRALEEADADAVIWLASRVISYMDEQGFHDFVPRPQAP